MPNFDSDNKSHISFVVAILKYLGGVTHVKAFKKEGHGSFNINAFNNVLKQNANESGSSHTLDNVLGNAKKSEELKIAGVDLNRLNTYIEKAEYTVQSVHTEDSYDRIQLELQYSKIKDNKVLPISLAQRVFEEIFDMPKKKDGIQSLSPDKLPDNFLPANVCKAIEFESKGLIINVVTATLNWAYKNEDKIVKAAKDNNCIFRYILTSDIGDFNCGLFRKFISKNDLQDKIKIIKIKDITVRSEDSDNKIKQIDIVNSIRFPIANDLVIYCNLPDDIAKQYDKFTFKTALNHYKSIALIGTSPLSFVDDSKEISNCVYYDIAIGSRVGNENLTWFSNVWESITEEKDDL